MVNSSHVHKRQRARRSDHANARGRFRVVGVAGSEGCGCAGLGMAVRLGVGGALGGARPLPHQEVREIEDGRGLGLGDLEGKGQEVKAVIGEGGQWKRRRRAWEP